NGSAGIAVGMATNIPPHNLGEIVDAAIALIERPETTVDELIAKVPGPDFPTGGILCGREAIHEAYREGRGILTVRARATIEREPRSRGESILVSRSSFQGNKARRSKRIVKL